MTKFDVRSACSLVLAVIGCFSAGAAFGAAPSNDNCSGAEVIPAGGPFPYSTSIRDITDATITGDPTPLCSDPAMLSRSLWYRFTPVLSGPYLISSCPSAPTATTVDDTVMAIFTSPGGCLG